MCGRTIDRYDVLEWVGGGGFGAVYKARHNVMHRLVALKLVTPSVHQPPDVIERFVTEARAAASIGNPHIIDVYDAGSVEDGTHFLAMELIDGCSLSDLLRVEKLLPLDRAVNIIVQVLDALGAAHEAGIVHRDIKPGNIMLVGTEPGGASKDLVKLVDFGISKAAYLQDTPTTKTGMSIGTPGYAAPEQYLAVKSVDLRADIYAASVVIYKMLSGRLPFEAETYEELVVKVCTTAPTPLRTLRPDLGSSLVTVVDRGMRTRVEERYDSAQDLRDSLSRALDGTDGATTTLSGPAPTLSSGEHPATPSGPVPWDSGVLAAASSATDLGPRGGRGLRFALVSLCVLGGLSLGVGVTVWLSQDQLAAPPPTTPVSVAPTPEAVPAPDPDPVPAPGPDPGPVVDPPPVEPPEVTPASPGDVEPDDDVDAPPQVLPRPRGDRPSVPRRRRRPEPQPVLPSPSPPDPATPTPRDPYSRPDLVPFDP